MASPSSLQAILILTSAALAAACGSQKSTASAGGQTGEFGPPPQCQNGNSVRAYDVKPRERVTELNTSVDDSISSLTALVLDETINEPYSGPGWVPDQVAMVRCATATLGISAPADARVLAVVYQNPSESCPNAFYLDATLHVKNESGEIDETLLGSLALERPSASAQTPLSWHFFGEQPIEAMRGTARPSAAQVAELESEWQASGKGGAFEQFFQVEVRGTSDGVSADLRFRVPQGGLPYAQWAKACAANGSDEQMPAPP